MCIFTRTLAILGIVGCCLYSQTWESVCNTQTTEQKESESKDKTDIPEKQKPKLAWDSPKMVEIDKVWHEKIAKDLAKLPAPSAYGDSVGILATLFKERLSKKEMREVAESFKDVPLDEQKQSKLAFPEIHSLVVALVDEKERETLLVLLSTRCPRRIGFTDIEFYLTLREKETPDAILLLGEAYDKAEEAKVGRTIADSFRRGFTASGIRGESDSEFVTNAIKWFKDNKESLS